MDSLIQPAQEILKNLDLYLSVFKHSPIGICLGDLEGKILGLNPRVSEIIGFSEDEIKGRFAWDFDHPDDVINTKKNLKKLLEGEVTFVAIEKRYLHRNGELILAKATASVLHDQLGNPALIVGMVEDLTAIKKKELAFQKNEKLLLEAVNSTGAHVTLLDMSGTILYVNHVVPGLNKEDYIGSLVYNWLPPDLSGKVRSYLGTVLEKKKAANFESSFTDPKGETHYHYHTMSPLFTGENVTGVSIVSHEISDRKKLERKLDRNTELMTLGLDAAEMGTWEWDITKGQITWDLNAHKIYGWEPGTFPGTNEAFLEIIYEEDRKKTLAESKYAFNNAEAFGGFYRIRRKNDKKIRWISYKATYPNSNLGENRILRGVVWDSTKEKEREINRLKSVELERQNKELKQFSYIASHDLQGPLKTVSNYIGLLKKNYAGKFDKNADIYLQFISDAVVRMKTQIKDLLDYSRIGQNKAPGTVNLNTLLNTVRENLAKSISKAKVEFDIETLPQVMGYEMELSLLFQNLISNALKFRKKKQKLYINISAKEEKGYYTFAVQDNGIGIEAPYLQKIFVIFQRLHTREEYEGTGIGLAHCQKIIELHQGEIWVESKIDEGSTFYFTLPIKQAS